MKSIFLLLVCSILMSAICSAQYSSGIKAGVNLSKMTWENDNLDMTNMVGGHLALIMSTDVNDYFSIHPELMIHQKGRKTATDSSSYSFTLNYLEVPVMFKGQFGNDDFRGFINVGPYVGFTPFFYTRNKTSSGAEYYADFNDPEWMNMLDYGVNFGGGVNIKGLLLEFRYSMGLSSLYKNNSFMSSGDALDRHRIMAISIGYLLHED